MWHTFEHMKVPISQNYDAFLKRTYSDSYMEFPPMEDRVAQDKNVVDPDIPYREYMQKMQFTEE